jgi:hypothetical protein
MFIPSFDEVSRLFEIFLPVLGKIEKGSLVKSKLMVGDLDLLQPDRWQFIF